MFLNYFALGVLIFVFLVIFYGIIILHDIPYLIAKKRNHPHADAIHVAGWVSLLPSTLFGHSCGSGPRSIGPSAAGACSIARTEALQKRQKNRTWRSSSSVLPTLRKESLNATLPPVPRRNNHGSADYFDVRGARLVNI